MIFICDIIIYPLIKKNKFNCVLIKYRYPIQEPEKSLQTMMCLYRTKKKKSTNILGVSVLGGTRWNTIRPDRLKPVGTRSD